MTSTRRGASGDDREGSPSVAWPLEARKRQGVRYAYSGQRFFIAFSRAASRTVMVRSVQVRFAIQLLLTFSIGIVGAANGQSLD